VSAVVVSHNEGSNLRRTVHTLLATLPRDGELLVVDDLSNDGSAESLTGAFPTVQVVRTPRRLGVAAARNFGARRAAGAMIAFSDAHVDPPLGWVDAFASVLEQDDVGAAGPAVMGNGGACGYGFTWGDTALSGRWLPQRDKDPYPVPMLGGFFLALRRDIFERTGGFDEGLVDWGSEDAELSLRLWTLGYRCMVVPGVRVPHLFRASFPYAIATDATTHNRLRIAGVHLSSPRLVQVVDQLRSRPSFPVAVARFIESDAARRRTEVHARRRFDDDWFCTRFDIDVFNRTGEESLQ
jgi:GT2 family glycosyltransferase